MIIDSHHFEITGVRMTNGPLGPLGPGSNDICGPVQPDSNSNKCMLTYMQGEPSKVRLILGTFRGLRFTVGWPLTDGNITV